VVTDTSATERSYYQDSYQRVLEARLVSADASRTMVYLDRTCFYPTSGGQPFDLGSIAGIEVAEVLDEGARIAHRLRSPLPTSLDGHNVDLSINWARRFDHMQQHTGQHILSAVFANLFAAETLSFHLGSELSTIDLALPTLAEGQLEQAETRANEIIFESRPVSVAIEDNPSGLRKASERSGPLRVVSIAELDRSACGGTHVRNTAEVGAILLRSTEKLRGSVRLAFLCGGRAVKRSRREWLVLDRSAAAVSTAFEHLPERIRDLQSKLHAAEKECLGAITALAKLLGDQRYAATEPLPTSGVRFYRGEQALTDSTRAEARAFAANPRAVYLATEEKAILLACSSDSGCNAGMLVKSATADLGARGGGSPHLAQATFPSRESLEKFAGDLLKHLSS
jgi:alanyl-tRNA synthetase